MQYVIAILYIALFHWIGNELFDSGVHVAFLGGIIKAVGANKMAKNLQKKADAINPVRPDYQIPQEIQAMLENSTNLAEGDMAGYGRAIGQAEGRTANTLGAAKNFATSGSSLLQSLALAGETERRSMNDINTSNQQFKQQASRELNSSLGTMAGYKDQAFQFNEVDPYIQSEQDKRAFQEASMNQKAASTDAWGSFADGVVNTGLAIGTAGASTGNSLFGKLFGKKKQ